MKKNSLLLLLGILLISGAMVLSGVLPLSKNFISSLFKKTDQHDYEITTNRLQSIQGIMPIVVIGSGPAALSAALYGARANIDTLVIEGSKPGGALTETSYVENWPGKTKTLGKELIDDLRVQASTFGATFMKDSVVNVDFSQWPYVIKTAGDRTIYALTIIIATGSTPRTLGVEGEQKYWGKGVTTCAICDAPFHKGNDVVVVGGGDSAVEEAMQIAPYAKTVTIFVRKDVMRAAASMQDRLKDFPNIRVVYNSEIKEIAGNANHVTHVIAYDSQEQREYRMDIQGVFLAIGHEPNSQIFNPYLNVDAAGYVKTIGKTQQTSLPGVYAAGDVQDNRYKQAGVAAGDGIKAALDAGLFLQEHGFSINVAQQLAANLFVPHVQENQKASIALLKNTDEFHEVLTKQEGPVVVDFYAEYCPSCMRMLPDLEQVAYEYSGKVNFYKVDMDEAKEIADSYHVQSIPALLVFDKGQLVARYNEAMDKSQLNDFVKKFVSVEQVVSNTI